MSLNLDDIQPLKDDLVLDYSSPMVLMEVEGRSEFSKKKQEIQIKSLKHRLESQIIYGPRIYWLVVIWLLFVGVVIVTEGSQLSISHYFGWEFDLSDTVMVAILGTTTASIIGMFVIILRFIFERDGDAD